MAQHNHAVLLHLSDGAPGNIYSLCDLGLCDLGLCDLVVYELGVCDVDIYCTGNSAIHLYNEATTDNATNSTRIKSGMN